ncbi:MAG TPA: hypothetical protein VF433_06330 [Cellvibrio sp.]
MRDASGYYRLVVVLVLLLGVSCAYAEPSPILRLDDTSARIALLPYVDYGVESAPTLLPVVPTPLQH